MLDRSGLSSWHEDWRTAKAAFSGFERFGGERTDREDADEGVGWEVSTLGQERRVAREGSGTDGSLFIGSNCQLEPNFEDVDLH